MQQQAEKSNSKLEENQVYQTIEYQKSITDTLQMFTGVYGGFAGILMCRDFKFTGFACYPHSLQSFVQGISFYRDTMGIPYINHREIMYKIWGNHMTAFMGKLNLIYLKKHTICVG